MADQHARVLAREGNLAVIQLEGRAFPGVHLQGDTFNELRQQLAHTADRLHQAADDAEALDDLQHVVDEMTGMLSFFEATLAARGIDRPYVREGPTEPHNG